MHYAASHVWPIPKFGAHLHAEVTSRVAASFRWPTAIMIELSPLEDKRYYKGILGVRAEGGWT